MQYFEKIPKARLNIDMEVIKKNSTFNTKYIY